MVRDKLTSSAPAIRAQNLCPARDGLFDERQLLRGESLDAAQVGEQPGAPRRQCPAHGVNLPDEDSQLMKQAMRVREIPCEATPFRASSWIVSREKEIKKSSERGLTNSQESGKYSQTHVKFPHGGDVDVSWRELMPSRSGGFSREGSPEAAILGLRHLGANEIVIIRLTFDRNHVAKGYKQLGEGEAGKLSLAGLTAEATRSYRCTKQLRTD
jgi:hypothetical protein